MNTPLQCMDDLRSLTREEVLKHLGRVARDITTALDGKAVVEVVTPMPEQPWIYHFSVE